MIENFIKAINATYRLLDFFPESDPLKHKAKEKTLRVLENITLVLGSRLAPLRKDMAKEEILNDIEVLKNYLQLGKYQGWVGGMNYLILLKEYDRMKDAIDHLEGLKQDLESSKAVARDPVKREEKEKEKEYRVPVVIELPESTESHGKALKRQEKILSIISSRGKAQVADIIKEIPNITKRTIRRDLDELLRGAKIVRHGEWNKVSYEINPNKQKTHLIG